MITLLFLTLLAIIVIVLLLVAGGVLYIAWPIVAFLVIGFIIDIFVLKQIFKKKKK